jgi:3-deoxy-D-manno-octulosonic-acid transferase
MYNPLDFWPIVRRALAIIRPVRIVLVEAEVWPNLAAEARARRIPLALVNARMSARSERRFRRFRLLVAPTFRCLDLVCVQETKDIDRWQALGVSRDRIQEVGSIKYDPTETQSDSTVPFEVLRSLGIDAAQPILFGGSTHAGEEDVLAEICLRLRPEFPSLLLIIAPRHAERAREIRARLEQRGLSVTARSEVQSAKTQEADCLILDTTGELKNWYSVATIVFIGKSLTAHGGQNPVEPILAGKPVLFGPHMENFASLAQSLLAHHAAIQIHDADSLAQQAAELLRDPRARLQLVENAQRVLTKHRGATMRTAELLMRLESHTSANAGCFPK